MASGSDGLEGQELQERFERSAERVRVNTSLRPTDDQKLRLYGLYKQAVTGACNTSKPGFFDFTGRAKWEAWHKLGKMSAQEAMENYLRLVGQLDPNWEDRPQTQTTHSQESDKTAGGTGGPVMSRPVMSEDEVDIPDDQKTAFDWCREGQLKQVERLLTPDNINQVDTDGMALLHWACDRGNLDIARMLVDHKADKNILDSEQQTPLHYASSCDHQELVTYLLSVGADPGLRDTDGQTAEDVAGAPSTRALFT